MSNYKVANLEAADLGIKAAGAPAEPSLARSCAQYWSLTKPRITLLTVFCAVIGSLLASDDP